jgi:hypothetical protein
MAVTAFGYPASKSITCDTSLSVDAIEQTVSASKSSMTFNSTTGQYVYTWKTDSSWTGCRQFVLKLADGRSYRADFKFSK